ncbi:MAG: hypothetical protein RBT62_07645 [Spirochaetia bacterium]|jgi:hypothetical protein|nr:hypothetical protein [Spirochaetia bacterium]
MNASRRPTLRLLLRLAAPDLAARLVFRLKAYLATVFAVWSLAMLLALCIVDTRFGGSSQLFHIIIMAALGSLPVFMTYPFHSSAGRDFIRRADLQASIETYMEYAGGPAERLLENRAHEALVLSAKDTSLLWKEPLPYRWTRMGIIIFAVICFVSAQGLSFTTGRGLSLSYPVALSYSIEVDRIDMPSDSLFSILVPETKDTSERDAPGARTFTRTGSASDETLAEPDFVATGKTEDGSKNDGDSADTVMAKPAQDSARAGSERGLRRAGNKGIGDQDASEGLPDGQTENGDGSETAGSPGWQGSGRALDPSPIVDYTARFERLFTEALGKETVLGEAPSAEMVSEAIAEYYASFDIRVIVNPMIDPTLARLQASWRRAFMLEDE